MSDFYPMETAGPQQEPLTINQGYNSTYMPGPGSNVSFSTSCNCVIGTVITGFFLIGGLMVSFMIYFAITTQDGELALVSLFPSILVIVSIVLGCKYHLCVSITVNYNLQTVSIKIIKLCFCCCKSKIIQIREIHQVYVEIDDNNAQIINGVRYNTFEIIFKLLDGRKVIGCSGVINRNNEASRVASILRNALPPNITVLG